MRYWFGWAASTSPQAKIALLVGAGMALTACNLSNTGPKADISDETKFSQAEYQVKASPRVTEAKKVAKGGGRYHVGKPYKIRGKLYRPEEDADYVARGIASWYGPNFHGRSTANGEIFDQYALSAAHPTMPLPSYARVTNLNNGRSVMVRVNDRGPFAHGRIIDLSARAAEILGYRKVGVANVKVEYVGKARMDGRDERFLMASYRAPTGKGAVPDATQASTMLAMNGPVPSGSLESAIETQALSVLAASSVPVPTPRPGVLAGGVPLDVAEPAEIQLASLTLGFLAEPGDPMARRMDSAFRAVERSTGHIRKAPAADPAADPARAVVLRVNGFETVDEARRARAVLADIGLISIHRNVSAPRPFELRLIVGGDIAGAVIMALRARGFEHATKIR